MPRWEAVRIPGAETARASGARRAGLLAGAAIVPVVSEPLVLRFPPPSRKSPSQGPRHATFKRPLARPAARVLANVEATPELEVTLQPVPTEGAFCSQEADTVAPPAFEADEEKAKYNQQRTMWKKEEKQRWEKDEKHEATPLVTTVQGFPTRGHLDLPLTDPDELVAASLRRRALQSGTRALWPRVRIPVLTQAMRRFGDAWPEALARCISNLRPEGPRQPVEVVAVRKIAAELFALAESREEIPCRIGTDTLPAVGSICCMQWYGDLVSVLDEQRLANATEETDQCWVVELALLPPADCDDAKALAENISQRLARPLTSSTDPPRVVAVEDGCGVWCKGRVLPPHVDRLADLREVVPRHVRRVFAWPGRPEPGEAVVVRHVLRRNPGRNDALLLINEGVRVN